LTDCMNEMKKWYIVYTRHGQERKVTESLSRKKIECYCPINAISQPFYRKKTTSEVLFCCYTFVRICETQIPELRKINGVVNIVFWLNEPFTVPDQEINIIKEFLSEYRTVTLDKIGIDEKVKFPDNLLASNTEPGIHVRNNTAKVILPSLGYVMTAETKGATIEMPVTQLLPRLRSIMDKIVG
jgi:transcription antitermination factor NusG